MAEGGVQFDVGGVSAGTSAAADGPDALLGGQNEAGGMPAASVGGVMGGRSSGHGGQGHAGAEGGVEAHLGAGQVTASAGHVAHHEGGGGAGFLVGEHQNGLASGGAQGTASGAGAPAQTRK